MVEGSALTPLGPLGKALGYDVDMMGNDIVFRKKKPTDSASLPWRPIPTHLDVPTGAVAWGKDVGRWAAKTVVLLDLLHAERWKKGGPDADLLLDSARRSVAGGKELAEEAQEVAQTIAAGKGDPLSLFDTHDDLARALSAFENATDTRGFDTGLADAMTLDIIEHHRVGLGLRSDGGSLIRQMLRPTKRPPL